MGVVSTRLALDGRLAVVGFGDDVTLVADELPPDECLDDSASNQLPFINQEVGLGGVVRRGDRILSVQVKHNEVRVGADVEGPFLAEAKRAGRARRHDANEERIRQPAFIDHHVMEHRKAVLKAVCSKRAVSPALNVFFSITERDVVGRDDTQRSMTEMFDYPVDIIRRSRRWGNDR